MKCSLLSSIASLALMATPTAGGEMIYTVTLDTSVLANNPSDAPFFVDFELNDGSTGDGLSNNMATISNFSLSGGSLTGPASTSFLGVSGDLNLGDALTLTDVSTIVDFNQQFTPGTSLSFTLDLTTNVSASEATSPDAFIFQILSDNLTETSAFLQMDIANPPTISSDMGGMVGGATQPFAPIVSAQAVVPEPTSCTLLAFGLASLTAVSRWRRFRSRTPGS